MLKGRREGRGVSPKASRYDGPHETFRDASFCNSSVQFWRCSLGQLTGFENGLLMKMVVAKDGLEGKSTGCGEVTGKQSTCGSLCG